MQKRRLGLSPTKNPSAEASATNQQSPPRRQGARASERPASSAAAPATAPARRKVLLVDDSLTALMMQRMLLSKTAYEVVTAQDGTEAIEKALAERPDLILMDIVMPQMSGFQACRKLRSLEQTRSTPILLVTTRGEAESIANGFASGCTDYITKPINSVELLAKIKSYIGE